MRYITIEGGTPLRGEVAVQGAKNSVLPILAATLLSGDVCRIEGCPHLSDVDSAADILRYLGCAVQWDGDDLLVDSTTLTRCDIPQTLMRRMRSSVIFLGAILARCGWAELSYPGGCELGPRPIDLHLAALRALGADIRVAGRRLFDWEDTLSRFGRELKQGADAAVFTHVSNVFGYILPVGQLAEMCRKWRVPFIIDAAQSAGALPVDLQALGADFIAMPGHKGLLGPQGTGLLLCGGDAQPLLFGGTGSDSVNQAMPDYLPDRLEAGTLNVPGYAGLTEGLRFVRRTGVENIFRREHRQLERCAEGLQKLGMEVFAGAHQASTVSFRPGMDCEEAAAFLAKQGIAVRAGLHCAPFAHESAGTLESGTVRVSFGHDASDVQTDAFLRTVSKLPRV